MYSYWLRSVLDGMLIFDSTQTDCGMLTFTDAELRDKVRKDLNEDADHIAFLAFKDVEKSVRDDVALLKKNPLVLDVPITGYIYDVTNGKIDKVE